MREEISKWVKQAEHDLRIAKEVSKSEGYDTCAFLCQQAVEKYLKALYIHKNKQNPPRTHYLDELGKELNAPKDLLDLMRDLSADYMISRYPDVTNLAPFEEYSKGDAEHKLEITKKIINWVRGQIE